MPPDVEENPLGPSGQFFCFGGAEFWIDADKPSGNSSVSR